MIRSVYTDIPNHEPSLLMMNCGHIQPGRPSWGSWITYGLGTENRNLPGFIVLCGAPPNIVGPPLWNSAFLRAVYQGTFISDQEIDPQKQIPYLRNDDIAASGQRRGLDLLTKLNLLHLQQQKEHDSHSNPRSSPWKCFSHADGGARHFSTYRRNPKPPGRPMAAGISLAAALWLDAWWSAECGACRFTSTKAILGTIITTFQQHVKLGWLCDQPIGALLKDLKQRGLLNETLVVFGTEFGRTPMVETGSFGFQVTPVQNGRDHNPFGFTVWMAGGGVKGGQLTARPTSSVRRPLRIPCTSTISTRPFFAPWVSTTNG